MIRCGLKQAIDRISADTAWQNILRPEFLNGFNQFFLYTLMNLVAGLLPPGQYTETWQRGFSGAIEHVYDPMSTIYFHQVKKERNIHDFQFL